MKISIRTKFTLGIIFFFVIIVALLAFTYIHLNRLSKQTSAILKENHVSVVCAREMAEELTKINQELTSNFILNKYPDSTFIKEKFLLFNKSLITEKNNITELGEDKIVSVIETTFNEYKDSTILFLKTSKTVYQIIHLQKKYNQINQQLMLLSQMNEKAIELKTNVAKISAKKSFVQISILGTFCFLLTLSFTYSFSSYFNERFFQLHNGIKEIVSSNFGQRLHFDGKDEFYDIALAFNEMAENLNKNKINMPAMSNEENQINKNKQDAQELKRIMAQMKNIEEQANRIINKINSSTI